MITQEKMVGVSQNHENRGERMKFNRILLICLCIVAGIGCCVILVLCISTSQDKWVNILKNQNYSNDIISVTLQKQMLTEVSFSDEDLIQKWIGYIESLEIKKHRKRTREDKKNGGDMLCQIHTKEGKYSFSFAIPYGSNEIMLLMDDVFYEFKTNVPNPFNETYNLARERHGEKKMWEQK